MFGEGTRYSHRREGVEAWFRIRQTDVYILMATRAFRGIAICIRRILSEDSDTSGRAERVRDSIFAMMCVIPPRKNTYCYLVAGWDLPQRLCNLVKRTHSYESTKYPSQSTMDSNTTRNMCQYTYTERSTRRTAHLNQNLNSVYNIQSAQVQVAHAVYHTVS